jgi:hypothetical protein
MQTNVVHDSPKHPHAAHVMKLMGVFEMLMGIMHWDFIPWHLHGTFMASHGIPMASHGIPWQLSWHPMVPIATRMASHGIPWQPSWHPMATLMASLTWKVSELKWVMSLTLCDPCEGWCDHVREEVEM